MTNNDYCAEFMENLIDEHFFRNKTVEVDFSQISAMAQAVHVQIPCLVSLVRTVEFSIV